MEKLNIEGYTYHSKEAAKLRQDAKYQEEIGESASNDELVVFNKLPVYANMVYDRAEIKINNEGGNFVRRIEFSGKVTSISGDNLPFNIAQIRFKKEEAPEVSADWNLFTEELIDFIKKGALGTDHDIDPTGPHKRPKGTMQLSPLYTDAEWSDLPIYINGVAKRENRPGAVPVIYVDVVNPDRIQMNSRISGYVNISKYTNSVEYVEDGMPVNHDEMFTVHLDNEDIIGKDKNASKEATIEEMPDVVPSPVYLSPEEQKEVDTRTEMRGVVNEIVASRIDESQVEASVAIGEKIDVPESAVVDNEEKSDDETTYIGYNPSESSESTSMSEEDLEVLHLIDGTEDAEAERDKKAAQEKLQKAAMERAMQQTAEINKAKTEGESVIAREENHDNKGTTMSPV